MTPTLPYEEFLRLKMAIAPSRGFEVDPATVNPLLKPHQREIAAWALRGGTRAIFASFGLGKTFIQLEIARLIAEFTGGRFLITAPLGVRQEFFADAQKLGIEVRFVRSIEDCDPAGIYLTNYETVRDGKLDPRNFDGASLDEAAVLRGFGGSKTFREFMRLYDGVKYKFVATATPSPNEFIELLAYAAFLGVMEVGEAKTRWFKRNSEKADQLTLHEHKKREFWLWVASWAIFVQRPSDLGFSDEGYELPGLDIHWHELPSDYSDAGQDSSGQGRLIRNAALGVVDASREKRDSLEVRLAKVLELRQLDPAAHRIIWHNLEDERHAIERAIPTVATVYGSQGLEDREETIIAFSNGDLQEIAGKPVMLGSGCNFQRHCSWAIFMGIGFKFGEFIQAIHRLFRFLQVNRVRVDLIYTEAEQEVRRILEQKWAQHNELVAEMTAIIREFGLAKASIAASLGRAMGIERQEASGAGWTLANNDCVYETRVMPDNSLHLVLTSIPFSTQYEYSPSYNDFGNSEGNEHFWQQMDYLTPELFRALKPGRVALIHVKDRIVPGGVNKLGFQTVYPFHADAIAHFLGHGFAYMGMKTIVTDVVRENNQTYRLGWSEQCKDATKMGCGLPEYLLIFRKPPSDTTNSYADEPVVKNKGQYSRSRWQIDAHGFTRSNGNRPLTPADLEGLTHAQIFQTFKKYSESGVYDFENHVALAESLERCSGCGHIHIGKRSCGVCECTVQSGRLPVTFMLLQPASWSDEVWSDVTRMLSLNSAQSAKGRENHLCPMQFDIADRAITQFSMPGELVYDPFAGLGTVPYRAVLLGRRGQGSELNPRYWADSIAYCSAAEREVGMPTLFSLLEQEQEECA
jgi:DNA modification methylase